MQTFVQQNILQYSSARSFYLVIIDGQADNMTALYHTKLIKYYSITSRTSAQTCIACSKVNGLNIDYCETITSFCFSRLIFDWRLFAQKHVFMCSCLNSFCNFGLNLSVSLMSCNSSESCPLS